MPASFPWEASFSFGDFGGPEVILEVTSFHQEASFSFEACVGSEVAFMVTMLAV